MPKKTVRILWDAKDHPDLPSGYGMIGKHLLPRFAKRYGKRNILIFAPVFERGKISSWNGMKVLPGLTSDYGENMLTSHWDNHNPTFVLMVGDWIPLREVAKVASEDRIQWVQWAPYDCLNVPQELIDSTIKAAWKVVPWTEYALKKFQEHNLQNLGPVIPLGVEPRIWFPQDREKLPKMMRTANFAYDAFNILILGANQRRKYWQEQLKGIAMFHDAHPSLPLRLFLHMGISSGEADLNQWIGALGLHEGKMGEITSYVDQYHHATGMWAEEDLAQLINCADVVLNANLEGFGLVQLQANACGVPVITLSEGPGTEIVKYGLTVKPIMDDYYPWGAGGGVITKPIPEPAGIAEALDYAYQVRGQRDEKASREVLETYNWDRVASLWFDFIEKTLMVEREKFSMYVPQPSAGLRRNAKRMVELI